MAILIRLAALALLFFSTVSYSCNNYNQTISILYSEENKKFAKYLANYLAAKKLAIEISLVTLKKHKYHCLELMNKSDLVIGISKTGFETALACVTPKIPILAAAIHKSAYLDALKKYPSPRKNINCLLIEQPIHRHINLITTIAANNYTPLKLGILLSASPSDYASELLRKTAHIKPNVVFLHNDEDLLNQIQPLLKSSNILFVLPEANSATHSKSILITALTNSVPIIGYSNTYVKVGALAAVFTSRHQFVKETVSIAMQILANPKLQMPIKHPKEFSIAINDMVAKTLAINHPSTQQLQAMIDNKNNAP